MPCENLGGVIACGPPRGMYRRVNRKCWTCETETDQIERWDGAWYGTTEYCLTCLDKRQDGCRFPRPFRRYWRRERQAEFQAMWDNACPDDIYEAYTNADVKMACANDDTFMQAADEREAALARLRELRGAA